MAGKATLTITDVNLNKSTKNLPNVNPNLLPEYGVNRPEDVASDIKIACTALIGLTSDTVNKILVTNESDITDVEVDTNG